MSEEQKTLELPNLELPTPPKTESALSEAPSERSAPAAPAAEVAEYGWLKTYRNPELLELIAINGNAANLLLIIAFRAWRGTGINRHGLGPGQAFIGNFEKQGMSEQQYRTAKKVLEKLGYATFKPTARGTIATLTDSRIYDINLEGPNRLATGSQQAGNKLLTDSQQAGNSLATDSQQAPNRLLTTNKELKKERIKELEEVEEGKELKNERKGERAAKAEPAPMDLETELSKLQHDPIYEHINVRREYAKAANYCKDHRRKFTKRFFVNWLNRIEPPLPDLNEPPPDAFTGDGMAQLMSYKTT